MATEGERSDLIGRLEEQADAGIPLEVIDKEIAGLGLPMDEADALSLYAWAWRETRFGSPDHSMPGSGML